MQRFQTYLLVKRHRLKSRQKKERQNKNLRGGAYFLTTLLILTLLAIPIAIGVVYTDISRNLPPVEWLEIYLDRENGTLLSPTVILDSSEQSILYQYSNKGVERRFLAIDPNQEEFFSPYLVQLTAASIEPAFWTSAGYHANWLQNDPPETIAETLVSRLLLWDEADSWQTSLRMRLLAAQITKRYGRAQIIEWYLNSTAYGYNTIGADAAARLYLGKPASELSLAESALLVATAQKPAINPLDAPQAALENQQAFLEAIYEAGYITQDDYQKAVNSEIVFNTPPPPYAQPAKAFTQQVLNQLYKDLGIDRVELGGIRVITTLDIEIQSALVCTTRTQLNRIKGETVPSDCPTAHLLPLTTSAADGDYTNLAASAITLDPATGKVLAYLGDDTGQQESAYTQRHQAGTLLTPLITVNAFARGYSPATQVWDIPASLPLDLQAYAQPIESYQGPLRLRTAIVQDLIAPLAQLYAQLGTDLVWRTAQSFGLGDALLEDPDTVLFDQESANLIEIGQFYNTFATLGTRYGKQNPENGVVEAVLYERIETVDGHILYEFSSPDAAPIVSQQLAYLMHDILQDDYERRSAYGYPNLLEIGRPVGSKYGHNADHSEVWTVGYTPNYTTVVWFGLDEPETAQSLDSKNAGAVWHALMQWLHSDLTVQNWETPIGISEASVCTLSGLVPTRECPNTITEKFVDGNQPVSYDNLFRSYAINRETGLLATVFTPPELVEERTYMIVPENALGWATALGIQQPPKNYDSIQASIPSETVVITAPEAYQYLSGTVKIAGTAAGSDLQRFQIQIGAGLYPETWYQIGEEQTSPKRNRTLVEWDTTEQPDGLYALRLQVVRENLFIENHTIQVSVDNSPPLVTPIYPSSGTEIDAALGGNITLQADVQDQVGIKEVVWELDGTVIGKSTQMPYSYPVSIRTGKHSLIITAVDLAGNETVTEEITFTVK